MFDDFDLPGFHDLLDLIGSLWDVIELGSDEVAELDQPALSLFPDGEPFEFADATAFWEGLEGPPMDAGAFAGEFGNMQFHNPFADGAPSSPIEDGSYDDFWARTAASTGIELPG